MNIQLLQDLGVNAVGVVIGGVIAFNVARWQMNKQSKSEKDSAAKYIRALENRVIREIGHNFYVVYKIQSIHAERKNGKEDLLWDLLQVYCNELSEDAYKSLIYSEFLIWIDYDKLELFDEAYLIFSKIRNDIEQCRSEVRFLNSGKGSQNDYIKSILHEVWDHSNPKLLRIANELGISENVKKYVS